MKVYIDVTGQRLKIVTNKKEFVSGSQNFVKFVFNLDSDWDGLTVFAQFQQNGNTYNTYLDENNCVYLPAEITKGECWLTLYGTGGEIKATTNYLILTIDENILVANAQSVSISTTLYDQLVSRMNTLMASPAGTGGDVGTELRDIRVGWNGAQYSSAGDAVRVQVDQCSQYRTGANGESINSLYQTYHYHLFEYTKEGAFYATQTDSVGGATVRRWDLPDLENNFIITNTRYGDNWMTQTAIQENSPDVFYRRIVPMSEPNGGHPSGGYPWRKGGDNFVQCREGINAQSATYNRHAYEYKKDGTFYVTPFNWDDLPTNNANYIVTNSRYGSWIMQTAVKSADPATVYRRFISNNPQDDQNADTFYTIAANNYGWELCEGTDITKYSETAASDYLTVGLPILYLSGNTAEMSKSNAVTLSYQYGNTTGSCSVKWQGSSSIAYTKKNYTIKFDSALDVGWGSQKKYCFKANYVDNSNALNVCGARLWSQIVADRGTHAAITHNAPNNGAMDGFPCILMLNGKFLGLYTWNIPKDIWAFGMGSGANEYIVTAEQHSDPTKFRTTTDFAADANDKALDFEIEYRPDAASDYDVKASINLMLDMVSTFDSRMWNYLDFGTAIDYMIFSALIANTDGVDKNFILTTYDGDKWFLNAYDLDSIMGNYWTGGKYYAPNGDDDNKTSFTWLAGTSRLFRILWENHKADVIARYNELRNGILSEENVYMTLYNFCVRIPQVIIDEDNRKYPLKPGTSTETLERIMNWYRMRCNFIDNELNDAVGFDEFKSYVMGE